MQAGSLSRFVECIKGLMPGCLHCGIQREARVTTIGIDVKEIDRKAKNIGVIADSKGYKCEAITSLAGRPVKIASSLRDSQ